MHQLTLILLIVLEAGPDLRLQELPWVDLSGSDCERQVLLDIANEGNSKAWAVSVRAGSPGSSAPIRQRLSTPLDAGDSVIIMLCRPLTIQTPYCVDVGVLRLRDEDPSDTNPGNNRWCWSHEASGGHGTAPAAGADIKEKKP